MSFYSENKTVKDKESNKIVAVSVQEDGGSIIAKALNFYFGDSYTRNNVVEMMHSNTAMALETIADYAEKNEFSAEELIEYLRDTAEEMKAQALVVSLRDELKIDKPIG